MMYVLNPRLVLKNDKTRVVIFPRDSTEDELNYFFKLIHPKMAVFLSLFNGRRNLEEVIRMWSYLIGQNIEEAKREAIAFLEDAKGIEEPLLVPSTDVDLDSAPVYDPRSFILDASTVDLGKMRCNIPFDFIHLVCYRCVTNCIYCYSALRDRRGKLLSLSRLKEIIDEAHRLGICTVVLSGGDPFCHPEIFEILKIYDTAEINVHLPTKVPLRKHQVERLKGFRLVRLQLSIDSLSPEINDKMVGVQGYTAKMLETLDYVKEAGLTFRTNTVLSPYNYKDAVKLIPFLAENYPENIVRMAMTPYGRSIYRHSDSFFLSETQLRFLEEKISYFKERYPSIIINFSGSIENGQELTFEERRRDYMERAFCSGNRTSFVMLPDGKVTVCEQLYDHPAFIIGNLEKQSIMEMWESPEALALYNPDQNLVRDSPCAVCKDFTVCHVERGRCYKRALQAYGYDKPDWPDPLCPYAPPGRKI